MTPNDVLTVNDQAIQIVLSNYAAAQEIAKELKLPYKDLSVLERIVQEMYQIQTSLFTLANANKECGNGCGCENKSGPTIIED